MDSFFHIFTDTYNTNKLKTQIKKQFDYTCTERIKHYA